MRLQGLFLALLFAGPLAAGPAGGLVDVPDPTDGGVYHVPPDLVDAVRAHVAAKQSGIPRPRPPAPPPVALPAASAVQSEALGEVNAARAARGLPPFQFDAGLTAGA